MAASENEFLGKLLEVIDECEELKEMIPDDWPPEAQEQAHRKIDLVTSMLRNPHSGLHLFEEPTEDGSLLTLRISKEPPEVGPG